MQSSHGADSSAVELLGRAHLDEHHGEDYDLGETGHLTGIKLVVNMISVVLASFLVLLDNSIVSTAIPRITDDFHSLGDVGWYGSAYTLGNAALQLVSGKTFQYFNLKWAWLFFFALFELGSALCGAAQSSKMLIVGRAIAGAGSSGVISGAFTIISACVPVEKRPPLIGALMGIAQLGNIAGPVIGGAFTTGYTWRWCFYINLPVGAFVAFPIMFLHIPEQVPKDNAWTVLRQIHHHLDLFGLALFAPAITQLLLALQYGEQLAWNSPRVIGLFVGAGANFIVWLVWNYYRKENALLPVSLVKRRTVWSGALFHGLVISTLFAVTYWLPIYFQAVENLNAVVSGVSLLPTILPQLVTGIACGFLVNRLGFIPPFGTVSGILISIATGLFTTLQPNTSIARRIGYQIIMGVGLGCGVQMALVNTQNSVSPREISIATAFIFWAQSLGPTIFLPLYNTIFSTSLLSELHRKAPLVDAQAVMDAGVTGFRQVVEAQYLPSVLRAYSDSIDKIFYLATAIGALTVFVVWGMGWKDIRKAKANAKIPGPDVAVEPQPKHKALDVRVAPRRP
ncbi:major facilitator superfamily domain-containing protein [Xylaria venustula]|nr:major facilitator superfamily domain-containing protein [Xylaria venustula]